MPSTVYLVTGGARSGKSGYAQRLCESLCKEPIYLATSKPWDDDFKERIKRHQDDRGPQWTTIEEPLKPSSHSEKFSGKAVLVDCLTLWLTNYMMEEGAFTEPKDGEDAKSGDGGASAADRALEAVKKEFDVMTQQWDATFVFVTNEIGSGTHASNDMSRKFVDAQGWLNQYVASKAERVVHMVCGIPNMIKEPGPDRRHPMKVPGKRAADEARMLDKILAARSLPMDAKGYFLVKLDRERGLITAPFVSCMKNDEGEICDLDGNKISCCDGTNRPEPMRVFEGRTAKELTVEIFERWPPAKEIFCVGHAAYIGREAQRAEHCLFSGEHFQQD